jgi:hypothetical protein
MNKGQTVYVHYIDVTTGELCCEKGTIEQIYPSNEGSETVYMVRLPASLQSEDRAIHAFAKDLDTQPRPRAKGYQRD